MTEQDALDIVQRRMDTVQNQTEFAKHCGISQPYLSQMTTGQRPMSDAFLALFGLERVVSYRRKPNPKEKPDAR